MTEYTLKDQRPYPFIRAHECRMGTPALIQAKTDRATREGAAPDAVYRAHDTGRWVRLAELPEDYQAQFL